MFNYERRASSCRAISDGDGLTAHSQVGAPGFEAIAVQQDPQIATTEKLNYLRWLREQIEAGFQDQLRVRVIEASCFPWGNRTSWESCATDECIRLLGLGHFSRTELVRSFVRTNSEELPTVYEVRLLQAEESGQAGAADQSTDV